MIAQMINISAETAIPLLLYKGNPVLTFSIIDKTHGKPEGSSRKRFNDNRKRFIEEEDFYAIDYKGLSVLRTDYPGLFGDSAQHAVLLTESGYLMLVKSFTDDLSWQIQRQLVKLYFRVKEAVQQPAPQPTLTGAQWQELRDLIHWIAHCCKWDGSAEFAVNERLRFTYGLRSVGELRPEHFEEARAELESLRTLSDQHLSRMCALDKEYIETVLRPPVSIRKVRAMAKKQAQQPPLSY